MAHLHRAGHQVEVEAMEVQVDGRQEAVVDHLAHHMAHHHKVGRPAVDHGKRKLTQTIWRPSLTRKLPNIFRNNDVSHVM